MWNDVTKKIELQNGKILTFYSEDLEVEGIVKHSPEENIWVAIIDWDNIRQGTPPYTPEVSSPYDTSNFDTEDEMKTKVNINFVYTCW